MTYKLSTLRQVSKSLEYYVPDLCAWIHTEEWSKIYFVPDQVGLLVREHTESSLADSDEWEEVFEKIQVVHKFTEVRPYTKQRSHAA